MSSLSIDAALVTAVLLADGWHAVTDASFDIGGYDFHDDGDPLHAGGGHGVCATGFAFTEQGGTRRRIAGPLTAVLAVRHREDGAPVQPRSRVLVRIDGLRQVAAAAGADCYAWSDSAELLGIDVALLTGETP